MIQISVTVLILICLFALAVGFNLGFLFSLKRSQLLESEIEFLEKKLKRQRENVLIHDRNAERLEKGFEINIGTVKCMTCGIQGVFDEKWVIYDDECEYPHRYMCPGCYDELHPEPTDEEKKKIMEEDYERHSKVK